MEQSVGRAKEYWLEQQERGYDAVEGSICAECVSDDTLKEWVSANATATQCSFCESESEKPIAADFEEFVGVVLNGIRFDWNDPDNEGVMYVSADGGYQADLTSTWDILGDYGVTDNERVFDALLGSIQTHNWVDRDYYIGDDSQRMVWGWESFKRHIKHTTRYFFLDGTDKIKYSPEIPPSEMLANIAGMIASEMGGYDLVTEIADNVDLFRIRIGGKAYINAKDIGSPPEEFAIQSNRMSPAGIPMFYGAFDVETAKAETLDPLHQAGQTMSIGTFRSRRTLRVLNLADLPSMPSVFDGENQYLIHPLRFLHSFAGDIARPIARDGREHIEYVPTQVVTEYFRRVFRTGDGHKLDGIVYSSSRTGAGHAFVLFVENGDCVDADAKLPDKGILRMMEVRHEVVPT